MATSSANYFILQGAPVVTPTGLTLLGVGSSGTVGALRRMTHPDSVNFSILTYQANPPVTTNMDNDALLGVQAQPVKTLSTTQIIRFDDQLDDVIISEKWTASRGATMPTYFFRQLYEYLVNPPVLDPINQTYITWEPRDLNTKSFDIQLFGLSVGSGEGISQYTMQEFRLPDSTSIRHPLESLDVSPTGLLLGDVTVQFRIVRETP